MTTLLIGHKGSIGRRYAAILNLFDVKWRGFDNPDGDPSCINWEDVERCIIATPTNTHFEYAIAAAQNRKPVLCEKPLSKTPADCVALSVMAEDLDVPAFVVCNYKYVFRGHPDPHIYYNNFNTGSDGLWWDVCQLLYLDPKATIRTDGPYFILASQYREIPYEEVEKSYCNMIYEFVNEKYSNLWTFEDGVKMTAAVKRRMKHEANDRNTSKDGINEVTKENLHEDRRPECT